MMSGKRKVLVNLFIRALGLVEIAYLVLRAMFSFGPGGASWIVTVSFYGLFVSAIGILFLKNWARRSSLVFLTLFVSVDLYEHMRLMVINQQQAQLADYLRGVLAVDFIPIALIIYFLSEEMKMYRMLKREKLLPQRKGAVQARLEALESSGKSLEAAIELGEFLVDWYKPDEWPADLLEKWVTLCKAAGGRNVYERFDTGCLCCGMDKKRHALFDYAVQRGLEAPSGWDQIRLSGR